MTVPVMNPESVDDSGKLYASRRPPVSMPIHCINLLLIGEYQSSRMSGHFKEDDIEGRRIDMGMTGVVQTLENAILLFPICHRVDGVVLAAVRIVEGSSARNHQWHRAGRA